ncbi:hypothetical protein [Paraprevotella clara]|uniref:hypothetical protein n=1 Tax=Paraprevotella clara TaxID=454154 RepID=UPI000E4C7832|nr:hypothetical protein [Paraprevotella clara]MBD9174808.1 hypothetical protein [Paraprevotella clara]RGU60769.1 hypothetical protein DWW55_14095 [Paraprevotella clara]DAS15663.1 MAG TPA: zinc-ribbon domain protein [Caudoviricetes sp.]
MLKIRSRVSIRQDEMAHQMATCPLCGQKLGDVTYLKGVLILRVKCRRCKKYVDIEVTGTGE